MHVARHVPVGAIMLDQEVFSGGASLDPNIRRGITLKNNAVRATPGACV
jgi:hypothetical protein